MDAINDLLATPEDEYHYFKRQWYSINDRAELIKDIFSFVNTSHYKDCYLIIGVDDNHQVVGIENDENRLNTQKLTDFLHSLPIANSHTPKVKVAPMKLEGHTIDIIVIKDTSDVPVYLDEDKQPKKCNSTIHAGQIFARENDTNTSTRESASDYLVERLWKKRFGLDLPIKEQYIVKLHDINNWEYSEVDKTCIRYNIDPDFCMFLENDDSNRYRVESYALGQWRERMYWQWLTLKYRDRTIEEFLIVSLDGSRFMTLIPNLGSLTPLVIGPKSLTFQYFLADSLEFAVEKLFLSLKTGPIAPDSFQKSNLFQRIVVFENSKQMDAVQDQLSDKIDDIIKICEPSVEEIERCQAILSEDFNSKDREMNPSNIKHMCKEANTSKYINNYLKTM